MDNIRDELGRFKKGKPPGPGRPAGSPEKVTKTAREILNRIMDKQIPHVEAALDQLRRRDAAEYLNTIAKLLPFVMPKMTEMEVEVGDQYKMMTDFFGSLTYEQLHFLKYGRLPEKDDPELAEQIRESLKEHIN